MKNIEYKKCLLDIVAVLLFVVISVLYFFPADTEGRILYQHDASAGKGAGVELHEYYERTGEHTRWTNSLFCGMPTYQMAPSYDSGTTLNTLNDIVHLWLPDYVKYLFMSLLGFYILLRAFDFRQRLAALGAVIWAFSSYFLIIIAAGHMWKVMTLTFIPPTIAGMVLAYKGKYLWGGFVTALFVALQVASNHVQMSYYFLSVILFMFIAYLIEAMKSKKWANFVKATLTCAIAAVIGVAINISNLYHTYEYSKETMRGKSELVKANSQNQTASGLERDYITQWSYGIGETWTLLVPNYNGGASVPLAYNEKAMQKADPQYQQLYMQLSQYWGEQPMTSGPVYVGAFVMFLFVLALFIVKGPMKWAFLAATILSVLLSWGRNFMGFTDFFIDNVPMYAKFRTVSSILVVAEFTIPLLAMMGLKQIVDDGSMIESMKKRRYKVGFVVSSLLTLLPCFIFAVAPSVAGDFISSQEMQALSQGIPQEQLMPIISNLQDMRKAMLTADAWRSFFIIIIGVIVIFWMNSKRFVNAYPKWHGLFLAGTLLLLCLIDMWNIDKRYLNDAMFVDSYQRTAPQTKTPTDEMILQDKDLDYRVLNFASNTFNENETSFYHKSIGGYHPAKLRRYQELIEAHIAPEMQKTMRAVVDAQGDMSLVDGRVFPVLNMLNTKYFIFPVKDGATMPIQNPYAFGSAWMVDSVAYVDTPNQEIDALGNTDLRHVAVADKCFENVLMQSHKSVASDFIKITSYDANRLTYDVSSQNGGVIVFSEIYYPGWTATVDGKNVELGRVNYVLRAMKVEAGKHKVELTFTPKSVAITETIAYIAYGLLLVVLLSLVVVELKRLKKG
ncbi:MAG: YfhO family protein [Prevotella sp.]|nr:YfhO family protein [Candidatus Equicola stercoris]